MEVAHITSCGGKLFRRICEQNKLTMVLTMGVICILLLYNFPPKKNEQHPWTCLENCRQEDPRLIELIRDYFILPPSTLDYNFSKPNPDTKAQSGQPAFIDALLGQKTEGFFIECGAGNGEYISNSLFFEIKREWTGLLIEPNKDFFQSILRRHRKAFALNACLSIRKRSERARFYPQNLYGGLEENPGWPGLREEQMKSNLTIVQCFPLYSVLMAIGNPVVDYLSLDVEGVELLIADTLPWDEVKIRVFGIEFSSHEDKMEKISFMESKGYRLVKTLPPDLIFVLKTLSPRDSLLVCSEFYWLIKTEIISGRIPTDLLFDGQIFLSKPNLDYWEELCKTYCKTTALNLVSIDSSEALKRALDVAASKCPRLKKIIIRRSDCTRLNFGLIGSRLTSLSIKDCKTSTQLWEEISRLEHLTEVIIPDVPTGFLPLILHNKTAVTRLEVGEIPNQLIHLICASFPETLRSLAFHGGQTTYSGIISLYQCKNTLSELKIRDPKFLTKHSLKMICGLNNLETLKLYWLGKMLINNPWSFDFCLDRREQRVDNLFADGGCLKRLQRLDLSAFYQTVDNKLVHLLCLSHLSSQSNSLNHLRHVSLAHCYQVSDAGAQWLVGSSHSRQLVSLDLSGTAVTGNCFLRHLPKLELLSLDCCTTLVTAGLANIAMSCANLKCLSLAKCKQINDQDLQAIIKSLKNLEELNVSYTNISGRCFEKVGNEGLRLKLLYMNSCQQVKDDTLKVVIGKCPHLRRFDVSATKITGNAFSDVFLPCLTYLKLDFCPKLCPSTLLEALPVCCPRITKLTGYGNHVVGADRKWASALKARLPELCFVVVSEDNCSDEEMREYARKRGLHMNNWISTKQCMTRGMPGLLSQIWLTSVQ